MIIFGLNINEKQAKIFFLIVVILGFTAKLFFFDVKIGDYVVFLEPWINFIKSNGYERALKYDFYDYSPSYIYVLVFIAKIGLNPLYCVKLISIFFEYVVAYFAGKIIRLKSKNTISIYLTLALIPLIPTVFFNSSYLSQCDSIYTAFIIISIYYSLKEKPFLSVFHLSIALAFKLQTIFIFPYFFVLLLRKKIPLSYFIVIPIVFMISLLPAWYVGRPLTELMKVYVNQADKYHYLTLNFPNVHIWFDNKYYNVVRSLAVLFTLFCTIVFCIIIAKKKYNLTSESLLKLALLSSLVVPFLLPGMHERYLYLGDILGVMYFLIFKKNIFVPISIVFISLYSYVRCPVRYTEFLPMEPVFFLYLIVTVFIMRDFIISLGVVTQRSK